MKNFFLTVFFALLLSGTVFSQSVDFNNPTSVQGLTAKIVLSGSGAINGSLSNSKAVLKILTFKETPFQKINSLNEVLKINGKSFTAVHEIDEFGNAYAVFEIPETGTFDFSIEAEIETNSFFPKIEDFDLVNKISENQNFVLPSKFVESNDAIVRTVALNKFSSNSWIESLREISEWTHNYVEYDWSYYPETYSTIQVLDSKKGTCDEYATLAAGMLRVKEIPTRFAIGVSYSGEKWASHAWLEGFNPKSGWIPLDPTYGEMGTVDGTHILMGFFPDPGNASDSFTLPSTATVSISRKEPVVQVLAVKNYSNAIQLTAENIETKAFAETDLNVLVKNNLNSIAFVPINLLMHEDFQIIGQKDSIVLLNPLEEKIVSWKVKNLNSELKKPQYSVYEFKVFSFAQELLGKITVFPADSEVKKVQEISIMEILPKLSQNTLLIEISVENSGTESGKIDVNLQNSSLIQETFEIDALSKKTISLNAGTFKENEVYTLSIQTPTTLYTQQIIPAQSTIPPISGTVLKNQPSESGNIAENKPENSLAQKIGLIEQNLGIDVFIFAAAFLAGFVFLLILKNLLLKK